jgi:hypothetical protein
MALCRICRCGTAYYYCMSCGSVCEDCLDHCVMFNHEWEIEEG